jgi:phospholysine phosphohistidine inorganic pyrophosphate phosphatase
MPDYEGVDVSDPNCVVLGDATDAFTYQRLNEAFRLLMRQQDEPGKRGVLISLGNG